MTLLLRILEFASKLLGTPTPLIPYPHVSRGDFVNPFHWETRRTMRTRFGMLFVVAFVSMLGAAACGGVQEQIQEGQTQVEEAIEGQ